MRICLFANSSWSIQNFRKDLIRELVKENEIFICVPDMDSKSYLEQLGCKVILSSLDRKSINFFREISTVFAFYQIIKKYKFDFIFSFHIKPNIYCSIASVLTKTKVITNVSGIGSALIKETFFSIILKYIYCLSLLFSYHIFFQNSYDKKLFLETHLLKKNKCSLLPGSGINTNYYFKDNEHLLQQKSSMTFSFIGRLLKDKGINEFLDVAVKFNQPEIARFIVYGEIDQSNPSSISYSDITKFTKKGIIFCGKIPNIKEALKESDCIVLPSYREGMSRSLLEAASTGIPIITCNVPGCKEIVEHEKNGFLIEPKDAYSLELAIERFLNLSRKEIFDMGSFGAKKIRSEFDVSKVIFEYQNIIKS